VSQIDDIVRYTAALQRSSVQPGIRGSAVIEARVTDVIDAGEVIRFEDPTFFAGATP